MTDNSVLIKNLEKAKLDAQRPHNQPTPEGHRAEVDRIEREVQQTKKKLLEEEGMVSKKVAEIRNWEEEKEEVSRLQVGDEGAWADGKV
jgi:hypothetical protein